MAPKSCTGSWFAVFIPLLVTLLLLVISCVTEYWIVFDESKIPTVTSDPLNGGTTIATKKPFLVDKFSGMFSTCLVSTELKYVTSVMNTTGPLGGEPPESVRPESCIPDNKVMCSTFSRPAAWNSHRRGYCIPSNKTCDGEMNCEYGEDERNCTSVTCSSDKFQCSENSTICLEKRQSCDGIVDCLSAEDEQGCKTCQSGALACLDGTCVKGMRCNGIIECSDKSDEQSCKFDQCKQFSNDKNAFLCDSGQCMTSAEWCNGIPACKDLTDEVDCPKKNTMVDYFKRECVLQWHDLFFILESSDNSSKQAETDTDRDIGVLRLSSTALLVVAFLFLFLATIFLFTMCCSACCNGCMFTTVTVFVGLAFLCCSGGVSIFTYLKFFLDQESREYGSIDRELNPWLEDMYQFGWSFFVGWTAAIMALATFVSSILVTCHICRTTPEAKYEVVEMEKPNDNDVPVNEKEVMMEDS